MSLKRAEKASMNGTITFNICMKAFPYYRYLFWSSRKVNIIVHLLSRYSHILHTYSFRWSTLYTVQYQVRVFCFWNEHLKQLLFVLCFLISGQDTDDALRWCSAKQCTINFITVYVLLYYLYIYVFFLTKLSLKIFFTVFAVHYIYIVRFIVTYGGKFLNEQFSTYCC